MLKKDILKLVENVNDNEDINAMLLGTDIEETFKEKGLTLESFKDKVKTDRELKSFIESENDKYFNKALSTWKQNNLEKALEPLIQEKYPDLVTDQVKKEALDAKKEIERLEAEMARKDMLTEAIKYAGEKNVPTKFADKLLGDDLDSTKANIDTFATEWGKSLETMVNEKMKQASYVPGNSGIENNISVGAEIAAQNNLASKVLNDPWSL